jgi:hypothetical protein
MIGFIAKWFIPLGIIKIYMMKQSCDLKNKYVIEIPNFPSSLPPKRIPIISVELENGIYLCIDETKILLSKKQNLEYEISKIEKRLDYIGNK